MPHSLARRMHLSRASGIHHPPDHDHPRLSSSNLADRLHRAGHIQRRVPRDSVSLTAARAHDLRPFRREGCPASECGPIGSRPAGLVQVRLVLYSGLAGRCTAVPLQHDLLGARPRHRMATDTLQTGVPQRDTRVWRLRRRRKLNTLIFFVTSHCNATCETCFYWDELNQKGDLSWDEIVKLSESTPPFTDLWFSGGEPTLRKELAEIIDLFVRNNGVHYINLPTNGLKPYRICEVAEHCLAGNTGLELHINIALDGLRDSHDLMRGVPGNFEKALESARLLRKLKPRFGLRLIVNINTVITRDNIDEIVPLAELIRAERLVDGHYFNLIRGNAKDPGLKKLEREKLRRIYPKLAEIQGNPAEGMFDGRNRLG